MTGRRPVPSPPATRRGRVTGRRPVPSPPATRRGRVSVTSAREPHPNRWRRSSAPIPRYRAILQQLIQPDRCRTARSWRGSKRVRQRTPMAARGLWRWIRMLAGFLRSTVGMDHPIAFHLILRLMDRRVFVSTDLERRRLAATTCRFVREFGVVLYNAPDTHLHVVCACPRVRAGELAHRLALALRAALAIDVPFDRARILPVASQGHAKNLPGYVLGNGLRHGVQGDPLVEASNLPDLLGYRAIDPWSKHGLRRMLPRLRGAELLRLLGVDDLVAGTDVRHLSEAAAFVVAAAQPFPRSRRSLAARLAAIHVGRGLGVTTSRLAEQFQVSRRGIQRNLLQAPDPRLARAIQWLIGLRERLGLAADTRPVGRAPGNHL